MEGSGRPIAVGIGLKEGHGAVVDFAAAEAARRGTGLRLVHAYTVPPNTIGQLYGYDFPASYRTQGEQLLAEAATRVATTEPDVSVHRVLVRGTASGLLEQESRSVQLVVVGQGLSKSLVFVLYEGRPATHLVKHAHCPLVVVPEGWREPAGDTTVVAVLDQAEPDRATLDFAVGRAHDRSCPVTIVRVEMAGGHETSRHAIDAAMEAADGASLVVVGRSGRRSPVAAGVLQHASCPVALVPSPPVG